MMQKRCPKKSRKVSFGVILGPILDFKSSAGGKGGVHNLVKEIKKNKYKAIGLVIKVVCESRLGEKVDVQMRV